MVCSYASYHNGQLEIITAGKPLKTLENICLHIIPTIGCWSCDINTSILVSHLLRAALAGCEWRMVRGIIS